MYKDILTGSELVNLSYIISQQGYKRWTFCGENLDFPLRINYQNEPFKSNDCFIVICCSKSRIASNFLCMFSTNL